MPEARAPDTEPPEHSRSKGQGLGLVGDLGSKGFGDSGSKGLGDLGSKGLGDLGSKPLGFRV